MPRMKSRVRIERQDPLCALILKGWGKEKNTAKEKEKKLLVVRGEQKSAVIGGCFRKKSLMSRHYRIEFKKSED